MIGAFFVSELLFGNSFGCSCLICPMLGFRTGDGTGPAIFFTEQQLCFSCFLGDSSTTSS